MKNLAQLYLLAALAVVPSLAEDMSPYPQFNPDFQPMGKAKSEFESLHPGIVPATDVSRLGKRQNTCPTSNSYVCPNTGKCCPVGYTCNGDSAKGWCCPVGGVCDGSLSYCPAGQTDCTDIIGVSGCCPTATHECSNASGTPGCRRLGTSSGSSGGSSGSGTSTCDAGNYRCTGGGCCPNGWTCVSGTSICRKPCDPDWTQCSPSGCCKPGYTCCASGGCCESGYACDDTKGTCRKITSAGNKPSTTRPSTSPTTTPSTPQFPTRPTALSNSSLVNPFSSISTRPTSTVADLDPTPPSKPEGGNPSGSPEPTGTGPVSVATAPPNGGNALKPGGWLGGFGGFGVVFFFVFFYL
ncbi:hypothetical protein C7212DRAFT_342867 [Tuber magnatum]|uniref:Uncharacterized protein n=1 Tax=Tuber magnatum TaxID=42249 RepID=A0A317ST48_9PEZI|nr:hypothetical protein C7212DRAFT_342867 [Tuber magnatum]